MSLARPIVPCAWSVPFSTRVPRRTFQLAGHTSEHDLPAVGRREAHLSCQPAEAVHGITTLFQGEIESQAKLQASALASLSKGNICVSQPSTGMGT